MADVSNFVIPESSFQGLSRAANTYERKNLRKEEVARQQSARKASTASFLSNYLDPKDNLTGTNYDPQIVKGFDDLLQEGIKLANEGADANMLMMALSPKVAKLNQYSTTAKLVNQRIKEQLSKIPPKAGYDLAKLEGLARQTAFYDEQGKLRDIESVNPNVDYLTETIKLYPDQVTTDSAIDEFVKTSPKFTNTQSVKRINSRGGSEMKKSKVTAPSWAIVDEEGEIVPRYETAMDGGEPIMHEFVGKDGKKATAPIRLMNEQDFDALMSSNPGIADWVRGQVMRMGEGANLNTPQAKNAARAIMYDELKRRGGGGIEEIEEVKATPAPRVVVHTGGSGSSKKEEPTWDLTEYPTVSGGGKDLTVPFQGYSVTAIGKEKLLAKQVIYNPSNKTFTVTEYAGRDKDGNPIGETTKTISAKTFRQNIQGMNPGTDMKPFDALISDKTVTGEKEQEPTPSGTTYKKADLLKAGWTEEQIKTAVKAGKIKVN